MESAESLSEVLRSLDSARTQNVSSYLDLNMGHDSVFKVLFFLAWNSDVVENVGRMGIHNVAS